MAKTGGPSAILKSADLISSTIFALLSHDHLDICCPCKFHPIPAPTVTGFLRCRTESCALPRHILRVNSFYETITLDGAYGSADHRRLDHRSRTKCRHTRRRFPRHPALLHPCPARGRSLKPIPAHQQPL